MAEQRAVGRGAKLLESLRKKKEEDSKLGIEAQQQPPTVGRGRAALLEKLRLSREAKLGEASASPPSSRSAVDVAQIEKKLKQVELEDAPPVQYTGTSGTAINATANYIALDVEEDRGVFEYEVRYNPDIDSRTIRLRLLNEVLDDIKYKKVYDEDCVLYLPYKKYDGITEFETKLPHSGDPIKVILIYKRKKQLSQCLHLYNVLFKRIMNILQYKRMGRNYFDPSGRKPVPQHKLEILPGYAISVDEMQGGLMICLDTQHRVIRNQSVHDLLLELKNMHPNDFPNSVRQALIGACVLTTYNHATYIVDDVTFDMTPRSEFETSNGERVSFIDYYYRQRNIRIQDDAQPLLVHMRRKMINGEKVDTKVCLVPELCNVTGLTDAMRKDARLMKDVAAFTRVTPNQRVLAMRRYIEAVQSNETCKAILADWGLKLRGQNMPIPARVLGVESIAFDGRVFKGADWSKGGECRMTGPVDFLNWHVYYTQRDSRVMETFVELIRRMGPAMGCRINDPKLILLPGDTNDAYVTALRNNLRSEVEAVVFIVPSIRADRYAIIKKMCCVTSPIPSQVIVGKTLSNPAKVRTIVQKIAMQITAKMGGTLWKVHVPFTGWMIIGMDVYHAVGQKSVCGYVASYDDSLTRWFSEATFQDREISDSIKVSFQKSLQTYKNTTGSYPSKVILFRDGVGDGQLAHCKNYELKQLEEVRRDLNLDIQITFVVIQKRINTRIFQMLDGNRAENPPAGTVVDQVITRRNYKDFYLIPQSVRQGTVNPTHYIVVHDEMDLPPDRLQRIAYKLCHLYYNWTGIIKVPAPCLYAHKLASLAGTTLKTRANEQLNTRLHFL